MTESYSVVIPAFNAEKTIESCLASVLSQTFAPLEVLIVDDHSVDGTEAAVRRCENLFVGAGIRFVYLRLQQNAGPSVARNKAMRMAKGSFIAFLDADDIWHCDKLAVIDCFLKVSNTGLLFHGHTQDAAFNVNTRISAEYQVENLSIHQMLLRNPAATPCTVVRREHALAFDETMRYCEDYDLWLRIREISPAVRLVGPPLTSLGRQPLTVGGLSGNTMKMRVGELNVYFKFCQRAWFGRGWLLPGLLTFSLLKHLYSRVRSCNL